MTFLLQDQCKEPTPLSPRLPWPCDQRSSPWFLDNQLLIAKLAKYWNYPLLQKDFVYDIFIFDIGSEHRIQWHDIDKILVPPHDMNLISYQLLYRLELLVTPTFGFLGLCTTPYPIF